MQKITLTIDDSLKARMDRVRGVVWSHIASRAFEEECDHCEILEKLEDSMSAGTKVSQDAQADRLAASARLLGSRSFLNSDFRSWSLNERSLRRDIGVAGFLDGPEPCPPENWFTGLFKDASIEQRQAGARHLEDRLRESGVSIDWTNSDHMRDLAIAFAAGYISEAESPAPISRDGDIPF